MTNISAETKRVTYFVDLYEGWQESGYKPYLQAAPCNPPPPGMRRFAIYVDLPVIQSGAAVASVEQTVP